MIDYQISKLPKMTYHYDGIAVQEVNTFIHPDKFVPIKRIIVDIELDSDNIDVNSLFDKINNTIIDYTNKVNNTFNKIINNGSMES